MESEVHGEILSDLRFALVRRLLTIIGFGQPLVPKPERLDEKPEPLLLKPEQLEEKRTPLARKRERPVEKPEPLAEKRAWLVN